MKISITNLIIPINKNQNESIYNEIEKLGIQSKEIKELKFSKRSIDSRKKNEIKFVYNIEIEVNDCCQIPKKENIKIVTEQTTAPRIATFDLNAKIAVIGTGPAGLFAAYSLCKYGYKPIIFERGESVEDRDISIEKFIKTSQLNPNSNIQFGEGGAGTYSDGKLNTRIKSGYINEVFEILLECGAQEQISWDYKPHIGTDVLKTVITNLRNKIIALGGVFHFNSLLTDIKLSNGSIESIDITELDKSSSNSQLKVSNYKVDKLILAIGHSARDTYRMLHKNNIFMENKPFAVGARIEHPREFIDKLMFGKEYQNDLLGSATYSLTYNNKEENRGVFSFCMCPGGVIVNAASQEGGTLVNGMSYSDRKRPFSNSALVVAVKENEFGDHLFSGMEFQEMIERKAYKMGGGYTGIFQNTIDFINDKPSSKPLDSSYEMKLTPSNLNELFPKFITDNMKSALNHWNTIYKGFVSESANLIGPETRTSAPVRIVRDNFGESINAKGIFPIGEGAGYAGGITSAAVDGLKIVDLSFTKVV